MGKEIPWDIRERAEELYIVDGLTYEQVAEATGVSISQLKTWGGDGDWRAKREEYRQALGEIKRNTVLLRKRLITQAMNSLDPQHVYAVARLEAATKGKSADEAVPVPDIERREIRTTQDAIDALQEAVEAKINIMLSRPGEIKLSAIKDMKQVLSLIDELKVKYKGESKAERKRGLSDETVEEIKHRILGIVT